LGGRILGYGEITFTLPSFKVQRKGFGDWAFQIPLTNETFGVMTAGLGKATQARDFTRVDEYSDDFKDTENGKPDIVVSLCKENSPYRISELYPEPRETADDYRWTSSLSEVTVVSGRVSGGALRWMADHAPEFSIAVLGALLGAVYGLALTKNELPLNPSPPAVGAQILQWKVITLKGSATKVARPRQKRKPGGGRRK
jgi:hypothetical protein